MIRLATISDLKDIAKIHSICFPDSFLTQVSKVKIIGCGLLTLFYKIFIKHNSELFLVAEDSQSGVVGFCMGYYMDQEDLIASFLKRYRLLIIFLTLVLLLSGNKHIWIKVLARFKHRPVESDWEIVNNKYESYNKSDRGDLLSVCVLPEFRGKKYAQELMESYLKALNINGRKICLLSVKQNNKRAIRYYERNGFELYRTRGKEGYTFVKLL